MSKRLSDITHAFERTSLNLEETQDELTRLTERAQAQVNGAAEAHRSAAKDLIAYLADHPDEIVVADDYGYYWHKGMVERRKIVWAHHVWVDDPAPVASYRVPPARYNAFLDTWEPRAGEADCSPDDPTWPNMAAVLTPSTGEADSLGGLPDPSANDHDGCTNSRLEYVEPRADEDQSNFRKIRAGRIAGLPTKDPCHDLSTEDESTGPTDPMTLTPERDAHLLALDAVWNAVGGDNTPTTTTDSD